MRFSSSKIFQSKYNLLLNQVQLLQMRINLSNKQNAVPHKGKCFNTKGYFDPSIPYDDLYMNAKINTFQKYREKQTPLRVLDVLASDKQLHEQKNLILLHCKNKTVQNLNKQAYAGKVNYNSETQRGSYKSLLPSVGEKRVNIIWKAYLQRKEVVSDKENSKFKAFPNLSTRINTEMIASRKHSSCSSYSLNRQNVHRQSKILKIQEDSQQNQQK